ncbi:MAG TPA: hypothetical protein DCL18_00065 [Prevotella sp.]|nr:hypothetical protein [Prevotella sp.]
MTAPQRGVILGFLLVERAVADGCFPVMISDGKLLVLVSVVAFFTPVVVKVGCILIEKTNKSLCVSLGFRYLCSFVVKVGCISE